MLITWLWFLLIASIAVFVGFLTINISKYFYQKEKIKHLRRTSNLPEERN